MAITDNEIRASIKRVKENEEFQAKLAKSREADVNIADFFTDDEIDAILSKPDSINGRVASLSAMKRYEKVKAAAEWLNEHSVEVAGIKAEPVSKSRSNAIITIDIKRLASLRGSELKMFSCMCAMADTMFISGLSESPISYTFGIENIWKE